MKVFNLIRNKKPIELHPDDWYEIRFDELKQPVSVEEIEEFIRMNFEIGDWQTVRGFFGYFIIVIGYKFKNEEDLIAFKLRWI